MALKTPKLDPALGAAVDTARAAAEASSHVFGVGDWIDVVAEDDRVVTHHFACTHPAYAGWRWSVTLARASRAKNVTVDEVLMVPGPDAVVAPRWVPWVERIQDGDVKPGILMPTPDDDLRLVPGYTGGEFAADADPAEMAQERAVVAELGLGRERLLSDVGRADAAERWLDGEGGPHNEMTRQAPGLCVTCAYFVRLQGGLGMQFGACANQYSPSDGRIVSTDHGCGGHSDVVEPTAEAVLPAPVWDTISVDHLLFD